MKTIKKFFLKLFPMVFWILIIFSFDAPAICILTITSALLHELGHIFAYTLIKRGSGLSLRGVLYGLKLHTGATLSYSEQIIVTLSGPLSNILLFLFALPFIGISEYLFIFGIINLFCAISSLLPIRGYDGYGIIHAHLSYRWGTRYLNLLDTVSLLLSALITLISLLALFIIGEGYWIFAVFFIQLVKEILKLHG